MVKKKNILLGKKKREKIANPFEVKINKQKHTVLNSKRSKGEIGRPGLSRLIAEKKVL